MAELEQTARTDADAASRSRIGLVVHPVRDVRRPLGVVTEWADAHGAELVQIPFGGEQPKLFERRPADDCGLVVAIGGDGTTLSAIRTAAQAGRPVLGVACGSLGALTTVAADDVGAALDRWSCDEALTTPIPALRVASTDREDVLAYNDIAVVRHGSGQLRVSARVDGVLYARTAGDGCIVSTPLGSSAYTVAAGGPLVQPGVDAFVLTMLPKHGGFSPPLVLRGEARLDIDVTVGHGGGRLEVDGRVADGLPEALSITLAPNAASVIVFPGHESHLAGLRRRGIISDSPRIVADDQRR